MRAGVWSIVAAALICFYSKKTMLLKIWKISHETHAIICIFVCFSIYICTTRILSIFIMSGWSGVCVCFCALENRIYHFSKIIFIVEIGYFWKGLSKVKILLSLYLIEYNILNIRMPDVDSTFFCTPKRGTFCGS